MKNLIQNTIAILYFLLIYYLILFVGVINGKYIFIIPIMFLIVIFLSWKYNNWEKLFGLGIFVNFNLMIFDIKFQFDFWYLNNIFYWIFIAFYILPIYFSLLGSEENSRIQAIIQDKIDKQYRCRKIRILKNLGQFMSKNQAKKFYNLIKSNEK